MKPIRNSAKAIIIKDGKLLFTKNRDDLGIFYLLPGGGQEHGETLDRTLRRECLEEIGAEIEIGDILFIREYLGRNHEFAKFDSGIHQVEFMFECKVMNESKLGNGTNPDTMQTGIEWLEIKRLGDYRIYPRAIKDILGCSGKKTGKVYIGDVN